MSDEKCRNCGEPVAPVRRSETACEVPGLRLGCDQWLHETGRYLCDLEPPHAEPKTAGDAALHLERQRIRKGRLAATAARNGQAWTDADLELAGRPDLPIAEVARQLGRTYDSVQAKRRQMTKGSPAARRLVASVIAVGGTAWVTDTGLIMAAGPDGGITVSDPQTGRRTRLEPVLHKIAMATGLAGLDPWVDL